MTIVRRQNHGPSASTASREAAGEEAAAIGSLRGVLVVTYFFPPVGGVGVQRTLKHVTYLPRWGWRPVVLTPRDPAYPVRDVMLLTSVPPGTETHRTLSLEPSRVAMIAARALRRSSVGRIRPASPIGPSAGGTGPGPDSALMPRRSSRARGTMRAIAATWTRAWATILFPDEAIAWAPSAIAAAWRLGRAHAIAAIYSSSPPISAHLIAAAARWLTRRPWVADFRDPWVGNAFAEAPSPLRRRLQARTERWVVERADRVVVAVDALREQFVERYPDLAHKFVYIPNGYDRADLGELPPVPPVEPGTFRIVFAGSLYRARELNVFLAGVELLLARRPELRSRLRVEFVGRVNEGNAGVAAAFLEPGRLDRVIRFAGFVPRPEALARMAGADALLQLMAAQPGADMFVGGKLLEYLAFDRPILAMMPAGEGRRLVEQLPNGRTADVEPGSVADALERLLDDPPPRAPSDPSGRYDRVNLAGRLAAVLDEVAAANVRPGRDGAR